MLVRRRTAACQLKVQERHISGLLGSSWGGIVRSFDTRIEMTQPYPARKEPGCTGPASSCSLQQICVNNDVHSHLN
jgi:hypothetical protein